MQTDDFEWDDFKNAANQAKHGVWFEFASRAFEDVRGRAEYDDRFRYGEDRYTLVGMVDGILIFVAYTERNDRIRIIMARRATKDEEHDYFRQNGQKF